MENLTKDWRKLSLSDREGGKLAVKKDRVSHEFAFVARFLTKRVLNTEAIIRTFSPLWRSRNGFKVRNAGDHILIFEFDNAEEVEKILSSEPWSFDRHLVVLQKLANAIPVHDMALNTVSLWVQVHNMPISFLNRGVAEDLCDAVGKVDRSTSDVEVDRGSFFRVRVRVDISIPLCRGRVLSIEDEAEHWVTFKYERLPNICYWCGCLDHSDKDCDRWIESEGTLKESDREYGAWIRAAVTPTNRRTVVVVPGFYENRKQRKPTPVRPGTEESSTSTKERRVDVTEGQQTETARAEIKEHVTEEINAPGSSILQTAKEGNHGIKEDIIDSQLLEIDRELNKVVITGGEKRGALTNLKEVGVDFPNKDKEGENKSSNSEGVSESAANHVEIISENPASNSETQQPVEPGENSSRARKGQTLTRTWTRIARPAQEFEDGRKNGSGSRAKRSFMEVDGSEVQNKKRLVLYNSKTILPVAEADDQPRQEQ